MQLRARGLPHVRTRLDYIDRPDGKRRRATILMAPDVLSAVENRAGLLSVIYEFQRRVFAEHPADRGKYKAVSLDLSPVTSMSLDGALVVTAEYHRTCLLSEDYRPQIDDQHWSVDVRALMEMLGFYKLVSAGGRTGAEAGPLSTPWRYVPFEFGDRVERGKASQLFNNLSEAAGRAPERAPTYGALVEAIYNVRRHAYPEDSENKLVRSVHKWWAAGAYDTRDDRLQFAVYDQGVGIPATLPRRSFWHAVRKICPPEFNDADVIVGAIEFDRTSTGCEGSGNGLSTICNLVKELPGSQVRIMSGRGEIVYDCNGRIRRNHFANPFCGTLILWDLKLPQNTVVTPSDDAA